MQHIQKIRSICAPSARHITFLILALAAIAAGPQQLLPAAAGDLSSETLTAAPRLKGMSVPREAVALSWPLAERTALAAPAPHVSQSKEYFVGRPGRRRPGLHLGPGRPGPPQSCG